MNDVLLVKLLGLLDTLSEDKGVPKQKSIVDKNVIKSENSTFTSGEKSAKGGLDNNQKKTLTETFNLFNQMFFDYQKKISPDTKQDTLVSSIAANQVQQRKEADKKSGGGGLMTMLLGGLALLAGSVAAIIGSLSGFFDGATSKVIESIGKLGLMGALKILSKTILKKIALKSLKAVPVIGGIIGFAFAFKEFQAGNTFKGIAELISGLLNFIPGVGPFLSIGADILIAMLESKGTFSEGGALSPANGWNTIKGWVSSIGKTILDNALYLPIIGGFKRFGMAYDAFGSGNYGDGFKQLGLGLFTFVGGGPIIKGLEILAGWMDSSKQPEGSFNKDTSWFGKIKQWIVKKLGDLPEFLKVPLRWFGVLDDGGETGIGNMASMAIQGAKDGSKRVTEYVGGIWDKIKGPIGNSTEIISKFVTDAWATTKDYTSKAWNSVKELAPKIWDSVKDITSRAWDTTKEYTSMVWANITAEAPKIWASIKESSSRAWDKTKEIGSWYYESIASMAGRAKVVIDEWIPKIVSTVSSVTDSAMAALKSIADKIGSWISGLFSSDEEKKLKDTKVNSPTSTVDWMSEDTNQAIHLLVKGNAVVNTWLDSLHKASLDQVRLLTVLANTSNASLQELKRMSGNTSGGGGTVIMQAPQSSSKPSSVPVGNNRGGFASSVYSLG